MNKRDAENIAQTAALLAARAVSLSLSQGSHVAVREAFSLHAIATRLHRWDERRCNEDLTCPRCEGTGVGARRDCTACAGRGVTVGRMEARNEAMAADIAKRYKLRAYFQGDCRGCPLYLIPEESGAASEDASRYNQRGQAVCHVG